MRLIYCYVKKFRNIISQEISFTNDYKVHFNGELKIFFNNLNHEKEIIYNSSELKNLHILVGKTGSGKTNILQLIGMPLETRIENSEIDDAYFILYETENGFIIELFNMSIPKFPDNNNDKKKDTYNSPEHIKSIQLFKNMCMFSFSCNLNGKIENIKKINNSAHQTIIVNGFDANAFASLPYPDIKEQGISNMEKWVARYVSPYHKTALFFSCYYLKEYIDGFAEGNIKRNASLIIRRDNWANTLKIHLPDQLVTKDYWLFANKKDAGRKIQTSKSPSIKNQFVHDLWTDYAIYLRKWISYIDSYQIDELPEDDVFREYLDYAYEKEFDNKIDPSILPDFQKMSIVKRIEWLTQYIDRKDGYARGIMWQIYSDIKDIGNILNQFDDCYFTNDVFELPIQEMYTEKNKNLVEDLFERMMQYRPDDTGIFTRELLPYKFSCISSGEWQYAKVLGGIEEYCVHMSLNGKKPDIIYLLDEPETYMHPELCRKLLFYIDKLLSKRNKNVQVQLIISTHSPFLLSDILPGQVTKFDMDDNGYCIIRNNVNNMYFGANIHTILSDGFFLDYTIGEYSRLFLQEKFDLLKKITEKEDLTNDEKQKLKEIQAIIPYLGDDIIRRIFERIGDCND